MMPRHARCVNAMPTDVRDYLMWYFRGRPRTLLSESIAEQGAGQADVVLGLLRVEDPRFTLCAEALVGKPITHFPPCLRIPASQMEFMDPVGRERMVIRNIKPNPRLPTTMAFHRYKVFREGMTVQQALVRGAKKRDIRLAERKGWVQLEMPRC
jgi:hypothetical protein